MNKEKVLNILGLAQRAGRLLSGDFVVERSMKRQVILVNDAGFAKSLLAEIDKNQ